ncbi:hypothetical protein HHI36_016552 [Cryptolaemus montrouzieri]|uniref:Lipase domain-containing protein n=1 Tax=Cryptolaemus montrouzieri TaxID=559131 RepID=A0ABD2NK14_9CUCU
MKTGKGTFYSYHEGQALKGPNEVSSFSNDYIYNNTEKFDVEQVNIEDNIDFKKWAELNFKANPLSVRSYGKDVPKNQKEIFVLSKVKGAYDKLASQADGAYNGKVPINHLKIADIAMVKQYIPSKFTGFHDELLQWPTTHERKLPEEDVRFSSIGFYVHLDELRAYDMTNLTTPTGFFDEPSEIIFLIHGWTERANLSWVQNMTQAYFSRRDKKYHVILVDWHYESNPWYYYAVKNIKVIGEFMAEWMMHLATLEGFDMNRYHIVSHSLGCHVSAFIGRHITKIKGRPLHRITALDAAGPGFFYKGPEKRLAIGDAEIIVAVHTDCGWLGYSNAFADVDFFPNGCIHSQPGCVDSVIEYLVETCSHTRSNIYWSEGVSKYSFYGTLCSSWEDYKKGLCANKKKLNFGGDMKSITKADAGTYYVETNGKEPYLKDKALPPNHGSINKNRGSIFG